MARQTWTLSGGDKSAGYLEWGPADISDEAVGAALRPAGATGSAYPVGLIIDATSSRTLVHLTLATSPTGGGFGVGPHLSSTWETSGSLTVAIGDETWTLSPGGRDSAEPYLYTLSGAEGAAASSFVSALSGTLSGTLELDDNASADHAIDAGDASWSFAAPAPTVAHRVRFHAIDAGDASWSFAAPAPTVAHRVRFHAIDAGDASWSFAAARPRSTTGRSADAGDAAWSFAPAEPAVRKARQTRVAIQYAYRRAESLDEAADLPAARTEALPAGWAETPQSVSPDEGVWRIARTVVEFVGDGSFDSATAWTWNPVYARQPHFRALSDLSDTIRRHTTTVRHKASGATAAVVWVLSADLQPGRNAITTVFDAELQ